MKRWQDSIEKSNTSMSSNEDLAKSESKSVDRCGIVSRLLSIRSDQTALTQSWWSRRLLMDEEMWLLHHPSTINTLRRENFETTFSAALRILRRLCAALEGSILLGYVSNKGILCGSAGSKWTMCSCWSHEGFGHLLRNMRMDDEKEERHEDSMAEEMWK